MSTRRPSPWLRVRACALGLFSSVGSFELTMSPVTTALPPHHLLLAYASAALIGLPVTVAAWPRTVIKKNVANNILFSLLLAEGEQAF